MSFRMLSPAVCFVLCIFVFACSDPPEGGSGNPGSNDDPMAAQQAEDVHAAVIEGVCGGIWKCFGDAFGATMFGEEMQYDGISSRQQCEDAAAEDWEIQRLVDAISDGRVRINSGQLGACTSALERDLCNDDPQILFGDSFWLPECRQAVQGQIAVGEPCLDDIDCVDQGVCSRHPDHQEDAEACYGVCVPYEEAVESCGNGHCEKWEECAEIDGQERCLDEWSIPCEDDQECGFVDGGCGSDGLCEFNPTDNYEIVGLGQTCSDSEDQIRYCELGLACMLSDSAEGRICGEYSAEGGDCMDGRNCSYGMYCDRGEDEETGQCTSVREEGEPCEYSNECGRLRCEPDPDNQQGGEEFIDVCTETSSSGPECELPQ